MRKFFRSYPMVAILLAFTLGCGPESSPEGRMTQKLETLNNELIQQMQAQNAALMDSLRAIRLELNALKQRVP